MPDKKTKPKKSRPEDANNREWMRQMRDYYKANPDKNSEARLDKIEKQFHETNSRSSGTKAPQ